VYLYEAVEYVEHLGQADPEEKVLGTFHLEMHAVEVARKARNEFVSSDNRDYAWWVVRVQGAHLGNFIADSRSDREFMVDLRTGELIEIP
jgi:hypothetical protein